MVRTRNNSGVKTSFKASRKVAPTPPAPEAGKSSDIKNKYSGGNPYFPRETPAWQKKITTFFPKNSDEQARSSKDQTAVKDEDLGNKDEDLGKPGKSQEDDCKDE